MQALSALNREVIRSTDEAALLDKACRILVGIGGYRAAWVGYASQQSDQRVSAAQAIGVDLVAAAGITIPDEPQGGSPVGTAIASAQPVLRADLSDPALLEWGVGLQRQGVNAVAAFPLRADVRAFGALAIAPSQARAIGDLELELLRELADDLAYGIVARRTQGAHAAAVAEIQASEERYRTLVNALAEGVVLEDPAGTILAANPAARAILGWSRTAAPASLRWPDRLTVAEPTRSGGLELPTEVARRTGRAQRNTKLLLRRPSGRVRWIAMHADPLPMDAGTGAVASLEDVTLYRQARSDELLVARLRAGLSEAIQQVGADARPEDVARTICQQVAGVPGVEFVAIAAFLAGDGLEVVATVPPDRVTTLTAEAFPPEAARYLRERSTHGPWTEHADALRSRPFAAGLPRDVGAVAFGPIAHAGDVDGVLVVGTADPESARVLVERLPAVAAFSATASGLLGERLHARRLRAERRAQIEQVVSRQRFHPAFQPIVDLETREPVGYEALTRFDGGNHPDLWFADAWWAGVGPELELATLEAAVEAARIGLPAGLWLDVNVSPRLLLEPKRVSEVLATAGRPVVVEVTEHDPVADYEGLRKAVRGLGHDVRLAVDDAGAGVANFGHIIELRPDFVKLDMSLVRRVNAHLGRQALVVAMRHFARSAGCRLVAEGIETELEAATLHQLGVEFGQGYLFGQPAQLSVAAERSSAIE